MDQLLKSILIQNVSLQSDEITNKLLDTLIKANLNILQASEIDITEIDFYNYFTITGKMYFKLFILKNFYNELIVNNYTSAINNMIAYYGKDITNANMFTNLTEDETKNINEYVSSAIDYCQNHDLKEPTCKSFLNSTIGDGAFNKYTLLNADGTITTMQNLIVKLNPSNIHEIMKDITFQAITLQTDKIINKILLILTKANLTEITNKNILESEFYNYFSTEGKNYFKIFILKNFYEDLKNDIYTNAIDKMLSYYTNVKLLKITLTDIMKNLPEEDKKNLNQFTTSTLNYCRGQQVDNNPTCKSFLESTKPGGIYYNLPIYNPDGTSTLTQDLATEIDNNKCENPFFALKFPNQCGVEFTVYLFLLFFIFIIIITIIKKVFFNKKKNNL